MVSDFCTTDHCAWCCYAGYCDCPCHVAPTEPRPLPVWPRQPWGYVPWGYVQPWPVPVEPLPVWPPRPLRARVAYDNVGAAVRAAHRAVAR